MTKIEQLQLIKKDLFHGEYGALAALSRVNRGLLSNYLKNCHRMVLRPQIVDNILASS